MSQLFLWTLVCAVVTFFVCAIPFGLIIAILGGHVDVRKVGSGNIGTTNVARSVGKGAAAGTLALDMAKGYLCMVASRRVIAAMALGGDVAALDHTTLFGTAMSVIFAACVLGHIFSPYLHFKGGKGIAVGCGAAFGLYWPVAVGALACFALLAVPTRYVSLGSLAAAVAVPVLCAVFGTPLVSLVPVSLGCLVVIWAHRANIVKLLHGEERRFGFHKAGDKPEEAGK